MFCGQCGKKVEDGTGFCPYCGASLGAGREDDAAPARDVILDALDARPEAAPAAPGAERSATPPPVQEPAGQAGNNRRNLGIVAVVGGAAVLLIVLAAVLFSGMFSGPKGTLEKAAAKSMNAYQSASDAIGMPDLKKVYENRKVRADMSIQFKSFGDELTYYTPELELLEGFGFNASSGLDLPGRKMDFSATAAYGSAELLTFWFQADDGVLSIGCPALLDDKSYGLDTTTLGRDLEQLGAYLEEGMENMSFNLFDIIETFSKPVEMDEAAAKALTDAIEVEKAGKSTIDVNGRSLDCTGYHVVIPEDAMLDYLDAVKAAYDGREMKEDILDLLRAMGIPERELADIRTEFEYPGSGTETLKEAVELFGDVELEVYVNDGYVAAVTWEDEIASPWRGTYQIGMTANFGGGKNYADDLSLELWDGEATVRFVSTGSHGTEGGAYTDTSTFTIQANGSYTIKSELEYRPKDASDNFAWTISGDGFSVAMEGQLTTAKDSLFVDLDKLSVNAMGSEQLRMSASCGIKPYDAPAYSGGSPTMLSSMSEADLQNLAYEVTANAQSWLMGLISDVPELAQLFW